MEKKSEEPALVIESGLSPVKALETAGVVANVRGKISYTILMIGSRQWKITLTSGSMEDLRKAIKLARGVKVLEEQ